MHRENKSDLRELERWKTTAKFPITESMVEQVWLAACEYKEKELKSMIKELINAWSNNE